jgi:predicted small lipoprotein YifL
MRGIRIASICLLAAAVAGLGGCGQKGALYLPEAGGEVITTTAPPAATPESETPTPDPSDSKRPQSTPAKPAN